MSWEFHADSRLQWTPGSQGKGNVYEDGDVVTWNVDDQGDPHHVEVAQADGERPTFLFYITPDGGINDGGIGYNSHSDTSDDEMVEYIVSLDPTLYKSDGGFNIPDMTPMPRDEGFGHAWNLTTSGLEAIEEPHQDPLDELRAWLDGFDAPESHPLSPHHDTPMDIMPQSRPAASEGFSLDPPSHPYTPYDWAQEGLDKA